MSGTLSTSFVDHASLETICSEKDLFRITTTMLTDTPLFELDSQRYVDFPFEMSFPKHEQIRHGFGPCNEVSTPFNTSCSHLRSTLMVLMEQLQLPIR
jgi:hypothetical protein